MPFKSQRQRAWMYANKPEMARRWEKHTPRGRLPNPVEALEELTGNQMLLVLLGVGIVGGGIYYLATRNSTPAATPVTPPPEIVIAPNPNPTATTSAPAPATSAHTLTLQLREPSWTTQILRPAAPGTFGTAKPPGPALTLSADASLKAVVPSGQYLTLILPAGGTWVLVAIGNSTNPAGSAPFTSFGYDLTSSVSIPTSVFSELGANLVIAGWKDASGTTRQASVLLA
jgi:hypothetical protein